jgi:hypothetical protein
MKKLLILMLVLGLVSAVSATPVISGPTEIVEDGTITLSVSGTVDEASGGSAGNSNTPPGGGGWWIWVDYNAYQGMLSDVSSGTTAMGSLKTFDTSTYGADGFKFVAGSNPTWAEGTDVDSGLWFTFDLSDVLVASEVGSTYDVQILDEDFNIIGAATHTVTVVAIPEPMTIALLGLGGLFLRRRK